MIHRKTQILIHIPLWIQNTESHHRVKVGPVFILSSLIVDVVIVFGNIPSSFIGHANPTKNEHHE